MLRLINAIAPIVSIHARAQRATTRNLTYQIQTDKEMRCANVHSVITLPIVKERSISATPFLADYYKYREPSREFMSAGGSRKFFSNDKWSLRVIGRFCTDVLYSSLPILAEEVETQTVFFWVYFVRQLLAQCSPLRRVNQTLKDGVLHSLTGVLTQLCHTPEPFAALCCLGVHIVCHQH